jgi:hypothetical protein
MIPPPAGRPMTIPTAAASFSRIFYGYRMFGLVSAIRIVGGSVHQSLDRDFVERAVDQSVEQASGDKRGIIIRISRLTACIRRVEASSSGKNSSIAS